MIFELLLQTLAVLYFFLPAYAANMAPVFVRRLPFLDFPLDGGIRLRGKRLFGANKTVRGLLAGVLLAAIVFWIQKSVYEAGFWFSLIKYDQASLWGGVLIGFAALSGDLLESTVKRQVGVRPGGSLFFWDQMDFFLASLAVTAHAWLPFWPAALIAVFVVFGATLGIQRLGYLLGLKDDPL